MTGTPMNPTEPSNANTTGMLRLFVYGTLKRGFWNHDRFCRGVLAVEDARVRGRLFETSSGIPVLQVPEEDILAVGPPIRSPTWPHKRASWLACPIPSQPPTGFRIRAQARPGAPCTGSF
jgi:hypothetical protein